MPPNKLLQFRQLNSSSKHDAAALLPVVLGSPQYSLIVSGRLPNEADVEEILIDRPPGKDAADKFVFGVNADGEMVGCVDLIRGYPDAATAFIGLLLLMETHQGQGFGRQVLQMIEQIAPDWACTRLRIAVIVTNIAALNFWKKHGFAETGIRKQVPGYIADAIVMEKPLSAKS